MTRHYLDHASTSPPRPEVVEAVTAWYHAGAADPGRLHLEGRTVRAQLESARETVAELLGARPRQVIFTSGGTEAINAAVWGAQRRRPGGAVLAAEVEHSAVRDASARVGVVVTVPVDDQARIDVAALSELLERHHEAPGVAMVHCQLANHEVGTVQPVAEVAALCRSLGVPLHVDACAAVGHVPLSVDDLDADLVSVTAHKLGGPPGIGALVVRRGTRLEPMLVGGEQERARRGGLEHVPGAVGFAAAAATLLGDGLQRGAGEARRRRDAIVAAAQAVPGVGVVGDSRNCLPHIAALVIADVEAEPVLLGLDQAGVAVHSGSSCSSEALAPSPVLEAMGLDAERSLRVSVGWSTTDDDVAAFASALPEVIERLRGLRSTG